MDDLTDFNTEMELGSKAHRPGHYAEALSHRFNAFYADPPTIYDRGRAARDIAASLDRLGDTGDNDTETNNNVLAAAYAEYAYREHSLLRDNDQRGAREFTVTAMYAAIIAARQDRQKEALGFIREGWAVSKSLLDHYGKPHQYDVNLIGRLAGIEGAYGDKSMRSLLNLGKQSLQLASISETNKVLDSNKDLSVVGVTKAKFKAITRGIAANAVIGSRVMPAKLREPTTHYVLNKYVL